MAEQPARIRKHGLYKASARSRITNGTGLLPNIDNRSGWCRRFRDVLALHLSDIPDASHAEEVLVRRGACLTVECERLEAKFALAGGAPNTRMLDRYVRSANSLRRILQTLGLERRSRDVTPSVDEYLASQGLRRGSPLEDAAGGCRRQGGGGVTR